jgi:hypothetical protein
VNGLLLSVPEATRRDAGSSELAEAQGLLKQMVLNSVTSPNTRRSYAKTLDELFAFSGGRPLTRALLQEWKANSDHGTLPRLRTGDRGGGERQSRPLTQDWPITRLSRAARTTSAVIC